MASLLIPLITSLGATCQIEAIVRGAYGGDGATYSDAAEARIKMYEADATLRALPICMSKTQYSLTDDPTKLGAPKGFHVHVKDLCASPPYLPWSRALPNPIPSATCKLTFVRHPSLIPVRPLACPPHSTAPSVPRRMPSSPHRAQ